jgi:hypothetical protein
MSWHKAYDCIKPYMVRIETETGFGTGFLFTYTANHSLAAIATACHVVDDVDEWKKPLRIKHYASDTTVYFEDATRVILTDRKRDTATILIPATAFVLPPATLPLLPSDKFKKIGVEVAWTGFPSLSPSDLCFFSGTVSFYKSDDESYFIDGVAINGVSGGPVFSTLHDETPQIIGVISAYVANRRGGEALPGLLKARDLTTVHKHINTIQSLAEAKEKETELQKQVSQEATPKKPVAKESGAPPPCTEPAVTTTVIVTPPAQSTTVPPVPEAKATEKKRPAERSAPRKKSQKTSKKK